MLIHQSDLSKAFRISPFLCFCFFQENISTLGSEIARLSTEPDTSMEKNTWQWKQFGQP